MVKEKTEEGIAVVVGTGHLGVHLAQQLCDQGREVRVLAYDQAPVPQTIENIKGAEVYRGDISRPESLGGAFNGAGAVYLAAAYINLGRNWQKLWKVNVEGVENVTRMASYWKVPKVIYFSSIHAMKQEPVDRELNEGKELIPVTKAKTYGESKAEGERKAMMLMREGLVEGCILSPTGMIGPVDHMPSEFGQVLSDLMRGRMPVLVDAGMDWVDVRDAARAALEAEKKAHSGEKYILSGQFVHMKQTAAAVEETSGMAAPKWFVPLWMARMFAPVAMKYSQLTHQRPLFTPYSIEALAGNEHISHDKATRELGFYPRSHAETVSDTVTWLMENGK